MGVAALPLVLVERYIHSCDIADNPKARLLEVPCWGLNAHLRQLQCGVLQLIKEPHRIGDTRSTRNNVALTQKD